MELQANQVIHHRPIGKTRNPVVVLILGIITLGIYMIIWYYCIFEELRNWRGQGWSGALYLILLLLLCFPLIVIPWLIPAYVGRMYQEDGKEKPITGLSGFWVFLPLIGGIVWLCKVQGALNKFWRSKGAQ